jgi:hypothetical protein
MLVMGLLLVAGVPAEQAAYPPNNAPGQTGNTPGQPGSPPPGQSHTTPGQTGNTPGQTSGSLTGNSTGIPGNPVVPVGGTETITFTGLSPLTSYHIIVHSNPIDLGFHTSDANGNLSVTFSTAGLDVGGHTLTATSPDGKVFTAGFNVVAGSTSATATASSSSSSGLAFTGARITGLVALALLLLGGGFLAVRSGRRRRVTSV